MRKNKVRECPLILELVEFTLVLVVNLHAETYSEDKAGNGRDEAGQERVEWKSAHQQTVGELEDTGEEDICQVCVYRLETFGGVFAVLLKELAQHLHYVCHCGAELSEMGRDQNTG